MDNESNRELPVKSLILETNIGGFAVTICACGVFLPHLNLAWKHIDNCPAAMGSNPNPQQDKTSLEKQNAFMRELIEYLVEDSSCFCDHHGYCQEHHGGFMDGGCWNLKAKNFLEKGQM